MPTEISWSDETWNPTVGCSRVSPGCDHCYAIGVAHRAMQPAHVGLTYAQVWEVMSDASEHTFQVLTKRPQRMADVVPTLYEIPDDAPLQNVWLGASIESDRYSFRADYVRATPAALRFLSLEPLLGPLPSLGLSGIGWVIVGGESGPGARPMRVEWLTDIQDRCEAAGVPLFVKQAGARLAREWGCTKRAGTDPDEWPERFRVQQFPRLCDDATLLETR